MLQLLELPGMKMSIAEKRDDDKSWNYLTMSLIQACVDVGPAYNVY